MDVNTIVPESQTAHKEQEPSENAPSTIAAPPSGSEPSMSGAVPSNPDVAPVTATDSKPANGPVEEPPKEASADESAPGPNTTEASAPSSDTQMKDTDDAAPADNDETTTEINGTPAEKKSTDNRRKSTGGGKGKLSKKKSIAKITQLDAKPGDYFFARLKSYPPWPSMICDEEMLPQSLLNTRPVTTMKDDGTYNEAYAEGGKKVMDRTYPVMFLHTNEFAWIVNTDLSPLQPEELKDASEKGKSKALFAAYQVAAENHDLQYFKDMLADHARAIQEDEDRKEARQAEKAAKADKKKRKSEAKVEDVEMEDASGETQGKKGSKKRKKEADEEDEDTQKPAKTPKTTKLKLTTTKTPTTAEKKTKEKTQKPKAERKKSKTTTSDEEMADAPEEVEEKPIDPEEARNARNKEVLFLRHKLQKGFLSRDQAPQEDEMPLMSNFIKKLENYTDLDFNTIKNTKINKVLKALVKLNTIPKDEEFNFRKRSMDLLSKWNKMIDLDTTEGEPSSAVEKESKSTPTTNGVHEEKPEVKEGAEASKETTTEENTAPKKAEDSEVPPTEPKEPEPTNTTTKPELQSTPVDGAKSLEDPSEAEAPIERAPEMASAAAEAGEAVNATE